MNNLKPEECLSLSGMHKKRYLNRQLFVTAVVEDSPVKVPPVQASAESTNSIQTSNGLVDPATGAISKLPPASTDLGESLLPRPRPTPWFCIWFGESRGTRQD